MRDAVGARSVVQHGAGPIADPRRPDAALRATPFNDIEGEAAGPRSGP